LCGSRKKNHGCSLEILRERGSSKLKENIIMKLNKHFQRSLGWGGVINFTVVLGGGGGA